MRSFFDINNVSLHFMTYDIVHTFLARTCNRINLYHTAFINRTAISIYAQYTHIARFDTVSPEALKRRLGGRR